MSSSKISVDQDLWQVLNSFKNDFNIDNSNTDLDNSLLIYNDNKNQCFVCFNENLINSSDGLITCQDCGVILDHIIDQNAEWRYYGSEDTKSCDPTRCGLPINHLLPQSSLSSIISSNSRGTESYDMKKIRKYHSWNSMPYKERSLYNVFDTLQISAINNGIPVCIIEDSKAMYKVLSEAKISRGANRKGLIASCIYVACKKRQVPRSAKEIADIFKLNISDMTKGCKKFIEIWNMVNKNDSGNINLVASQPDDFIERFCSKLGMPEDITKICYNIAQKAVRLSLVSENTPPSIAAGSIYLVSQIYQLNLTKKELSSACKISEVTISKCYKKLENSKESLLQS